MRGLSGLVIGAVLASQAMAQDQCIHTDLILDMADHVLAAEGDNPTRLGARLAYFKIQYGDLAGEEVETLLNTLVQDGAYGADELQETYNLSQDGGLAMWQGDSDDVLARFRTLAPSTARALIKADAGTTYLRLWRLTRATGDQALIDARAKALHALYVSDLPDNARRLIAQKAENNGAIYFAAGLLADHSDPSLFDAILERYDAEFETGTLPNAWQFARFSRRVQDRLVSDPALEIFAPDLLAQEYGVERAAALTYPVSFLYTYHNQGGARDATYEAVDAVTHAYEGEALDPLTDPESVWTLTYRSLLDNSPPDDVRRVLRSYDWGWQRRWYDDTSALGQLDVMLAKDLFGPFVRGQDDGMPNPPDATTVDWDVWAAAAQVVRNGGADPAEGYVALVELLWEAGRFDDAWSVVAAAPMGFQNHQTARDLASRLDMLCDQHSVLPTLEGRTGRQFFIHFQ